MESPSEVRQGHRTISHSPLCDIPHAWKVTLGSYTTVIQGRAH